MKGWRSLENLRTVSARSIAGVLAVVVVLAADAVVLHSRALWEALAPAVREHPVERGIVRDRLTIQRLREAPPGQPRVVVVGSSRARAGFQPATLGRAERGMFAVGELAHGGIGPFEIRSAVGDILGAKADAVVLVLSDYEITRPAYLRPSLHYGSLSAIRDLIRENGVAYAVENRSDLYRSTLGCLLHTYRFRGVFQRVFADNLRRFTFDERFEPNEARIPPFRAMPELAESKIRMRLSSPEGQVILTRLEKIFGRDVRWSLRQVLSITWGDHIRVNRALLRATVQRLSGAGVKVVIAEAPNHPEAAEFYDASIRVEFLSIVESLERGFGIRFIPVEASGPYGPADFYDLTHLNGGPEGTTKLTRAIVSVVSEMLELEAFPSS